MPDNRQIQNNAVPNSSNGTVDNMEERVRRMKIENGDDNSPEKSVGGNPPYPDRPGEPDCIYYLRTGLCGYGSNCRFNHPTNTVKSVQINGELPQRLGQPDCGFYLKTGTCKYGSTCKYHHPRDRCVAGPAPLNALGLPIRQDEKSCPYYMRTYTCKFGVACKFNHPQPAPMLPVPAPSTTKLGAIGSMDYSSMGMPYTSGIMTWLQPGAPYLPGPRVAVPQSYAPYIAPSPQVSIMAAQGWNTYMGNLSPTGTYGTSFYNPQDQSAFANGLVDTSKVLNLPDRPDQPECRHFMSTGSCRYGSDCKYHHPKEKIAQLAMYSLGPHGLPLRPGEAMCSYFITYGVCKYGQTCKYNHPVGGYYSSPYYGQQPSPVPVLGQPPALPYHQRNSSSVKEDNNNNYNPDASSPSKSSKINEWIQKPESMEEVVHKEYSSDSKSPEDSKDIEVSSKD